MFKIKNLGNLVSNIANNNMPNIDILEETKNFSIQDFYLNSDKYDGAVIIITPKQTIKTPLVYGYSHGAMVEKIYQEIIPDFSNFSENNKSIEILNDNDLSMQTSWEEEMSKGFNNIILKLVKFKEGNRSYGFNEGIIPETINSYQYEELIKLNNEMLKSNIEINFYYPYNDFPEDTYKNLDYLVATLYDNIDDNTESNEIILTEEENFKRK